MEGSQAKHNKNRKKVTFKLVSASYADPRVSQNPCQRTLMLKESQNDTWKNRNHSTIPKDFLNFINPADFGIHSNLPEAQKDELIKEIYGTREEYERIAAKFAHLNVSQKPTDEDLDGDCYFPRDGYDYSQHLATIIPENFIPAVKKTLPETVPNGVEIPKDFPSLQDAVNKAPEDLDMAEVLNALDEDASDLEAMDDDFVAKAMDNEDPDTFIDENQLLWGGYKPLRRVMFDDDVVFGADLKDCDASEDSEGGDELSDAEDIEDKDAILEEGIPEALMEALKNGRFGHHEDEKYSMEVMDPDGDVNEQILQLVEQLDDNEGYDSYDYAESSDDSEQWDVQTVLTKYTNATNHPQRIRTNVIQKVKALEKVTVEQPSTKPIDEVEHVELPPVITTRNRNETADERKARKAAVKQAKALITRMKKENKGALKDAKKKATEMNSRGSYDIINGVKYIRLK
ncbi:hypothetical protein X943_000644 [Babesia divergens]|uniref:Protein LTV1 homolog n=1 Tax=Babesia divergens TaxID=32595 RepID=A0AAD9GA89_BABDI|nr:hypothetical protein X943_000644 [Babesia divergens]